MYRPDLCDETVDRKIAGVRIVRIDHLRNEDIRAQLRQERIVEQVGRKREVWKKQVEEQIGSRDGNAWSCTREKTKKKAKKAMERCLLTDAKMLTFAVQDYCYPLSNDNSVLVILGILHSI